MAKKKGILIKEEVGFVPERVKGENKDNGKVQNKKK